MWWKKLLGVFTGKLPETVVEYYKEKNKLKQDLKLAKLRGAIDNQNAKNERRAAQQKHIQTWEQMYVQLQRESLKDEVVLAVFLWPFVGVFVPVLQDYVLRGFDYLAKVPPWWVAISVAISLAIYGIRHKRANKINAPGLTAE